MKIIHITPGTGGTFYCQNCLRDNEYIHALREAGHDVKMVPLYLPLNLDENNTVETTPVFYGAINVYLKQMLPIYRKAPVWLEKLFDSMPLLKMVAKKSGSTNAKGMEEMTISMLKGENGKQASELEHLICWLRRTGGDVVHLSNALLLGLARRIKQELGIAVVCSLEDENEWIDPMDESYQQQVWDTMAERATDVDAFIATSDYFAGYMKQRMRIPDEKLFRVYPGIHLEPYEQAPLSFDPPVIGYLSRMSEENGLGILVDAFIQLKKQSQFSNLKLAISGGYTSEDKRFFDNTRKKLIVAGVMDDVTIYPDFSLTERLEFFKSLSVFSVPVPQGEAFGIFLVEALAAGVPVVQPDVGGFPEFIRQTAGGILCQSNDSVSLASALNELLTDQDLARKMGATGMNAVQRAFSIQKMTDNMIDVYQSILT